MHLWGHPSKDLCVSDCLRIPLVQTPFWENPRPPFYLPLPASLLFPEGTFKAPPPFFFLLHKQHYGNIRILNPKKKSPTISGSDKLNCFYLPMFPCSPRPNAHKIFAQLCSWHRSHFAFCPFSFLFCHQQFSALLPGHHLPHCYYCIMFQWVNNLIITALM